ncbi:MAG: hypothetical protein IPG71_09315 [bacterium]|jgi:hypothetical protein|nr:hypothetical protein [bacterium]
MQTKDFGLVTTLTAKGHRFLDYQVDELGRIFFRFQDSPETKAIEDGFFKNSITVQVQDFINAQTTMKTLVFDIRRKVDANANRFTGNRIANTYHAN